MPGASPSIGYRDFWKIKHRCNYADIGGSLHATHSMHLSAL